MLHILGLFPMFIGNPNSTLSGCINVGVSVISRNYLLYYLLFTCMDQLWTILLTSISIFQYLDPLAPFYTECLKSENVDLGVILGHTTFRIYITMPYS